MLLPADGACSANQPHDEHAARVERDHAGDRQDARRRQLREAAREMRRFRCTRPSSPSSSTTIHAECDDVQQHQPRERHELVVAHERRARGARGRRRTRPPCRSRPCDRHPCARPAVRCLRAADRRSPARRAARTTRARRDGARPPQSIGRAGPAAACRGPSSPCLGRPQADGLLQRLIRLPHGGAVRSGPVQTPGESDGARHGRSSWRDSTKPLASIRVSVT